ncbi:MocR-like pyridoxine biosynthesis transcription factor PdxR [Paenibacillus koleovorans]|uniref:MocR-like pyridoxine biosynthesis transcription factor PdxR n=1 Tax=Paenibacillus koleovorans TaxID=121608 RepID=UPI0013E34403|nr:PLP-dependent aminotransferase family protein [Paenibacillus koleovorans]
MLMPPQVGELPAQPHYLKIYHFYREHILLGTMPIGAKLPSIRALALHLGVSRNPVEEAYAHLVAEGYIVNKPKSGYWVASIPQLPSGLSPQSEEGTKATPITDSGRSGEHEVVVDFAYDRIRSGSFPIALWKKLTQHTLREAGPELFEYGDRKGELQLRRCIQAYVRQHRGVVCDSQQIIVTSGTQQSALMIGLLLRSDRRPLGAEAAMHPGLHRILEQQLQHGLVPVPLDEDGISCEALERLNTLYALCGVYVTPSHQFPYGSILPASKRARLLQWASDSGAWIIEDDYDSEFIYDGQPLPALQGMDRHGRVIYMGTFSKALAPALRLSYLVLPPELLARYEEEFRDYDGTASRVIQVTMARFMAEGLLDRHIRKMRSVYSLNRKRLLDAVACYMKGKANVSGAGSGLHARLSVQSLGLPTEELVKRGRLAGVGIRAVTDFHHAPAATSATFCEPQGEVEFVIGYGGLSGAQIEEGIRKLAEVWGM